MLTMVMIVEKEKIEHIMFDKVEKEIFLQRLLTVWLKMFKPAESKNDYNVWQILIDEWLTVWLRMIFQPAESKTALRHVLAQAARVEVVCDGPAGGRIIDDISIYIRCIIYSISTFCWRDNR